MSAPQRHQVENLAWHVLVRVSFVAPTRVRIDRSTLNGKWISFLRKGHA